MFSESCANQDEYAQTVTSYVSFCTDSSIPSKTVTIYANDKPWFSKDIKHKLIAKSDAFNNSDKNQYKAAEYEAEKAMRRAKAQYRKKFSTSNSHAVWQGLQQNTQYKQKPTPANSDPILTDQLNHFYSRFDRKNSTKASSHSVPPDSDSGLPPPPFTVRPWEVKYLFTKLNIRKAAGPDSISPSTLKFCAEQLAPIFCEIYNHSLSPCKVPTCFKSSTIIPVPQNPKVSSLNGYRPVARTSIAMKVFECLVLRYLKTATDSARPTSVCLQSKQVSGRCSMPRSTPCSQTPRLPQHLCTYTLHGLQFSVQHNHTT